MSFLSIIFAAINLQNLSYYPPEIAIDSLLEGVRFRISGCITPEPGLPDLPIREVIVGVPQKGRIEIEVEPGDYEVRKGVDITPVPKRFPDRSPIYEKDPKIYGRDEFYPSRLVRIKEIGWLRNIKVAIVEISPVQYNPKKREVRIYRDIKYKIKSSSPPSKSFKKDSFDKLYKRMIINYDECRDWRGLPSLPKIKTPFNESRNWIKVKIRDQGVYKIGYKNLKELGISPSLINPKTFKIFNIGNFIPRESYPDSMVEVPIYVYGEEDGRFDKGDYILFYSHPVSYWDYEKEKFVNNPYTWYNYYWLSWGGDEGRRFTKKRTVSGEGVKINSSTSVFHLEQEGDNPGRGGNLWIWREFSSDNSSPLDTAFILPHAESLFSATLAFYPTEWYDSPLKFSEIEVSINSELLATLHFTEKCNSCAPSPAKRTVQINKETGEKVGLLLRPLGTKTHPLYLNYIEFTYKQKFSLKNRDLLVFLAFPGVYKFEVKDVSSSPFILDITDYPNSSLISDFELSQGILKFKVEVESQGLFYLTEKERFLKPLSLEIREPGSLLSSRFKPDYIIVSPDEFYQAALVLAQYRREKGMKNIEVVKISQVYDDFGFGLEDPIAIKRLFSVKQPHYGLLTSEGNYDYRGIRYRQDFTMVPPYEIGRSVDPNCAFHGDETSYEAWYADWDGGGSTPDMALGRICVRNTRELRGFLDKLIGYESSPGGWMKKFILLGDDVWERNPGDPDVGATHINNCENVANAISNRFDLVKIYLTEYPYEGTPPKPEATKALKKEWNKGASGFCFFGHGCGSQLTHEAVFMTGDVASLYNDKKLPVAFFGSCMVGRFDDTKYQCIAEELVRSPTGGTIASMAASSGTGSSSNENFAISLFTSLLSDTLNLGQAFYIAWPKETATILFGDPAMEFQIPKKGGEIETEPPYLQLGGETQVTADVDIKSGRYGLSAYAPQYRRTYEWTERDKKYSMQYILPGKEFHYGLGKIENDTIKAKFFTPKELGPDSIKVQDGLYKKIKNSASISIAAWDSEKRCRLYKGPIRVESPGSQEDKQGPKITLYADNRPIMEGDRLPERFTLVGKLSDPSGILSADINTTPKHNFLFYVNTPDNAVYLYDYFRYYENSNSSGEFSSPANLPEPIDTIVVIAYDNLFNQTIKRVEVERYATTERLSIKNPLVYPNSIKKDGYFTFHLNKPAWVKIKIYTVSGRLIKIFEERRCSYGYNQIHWDGKDGDGDYPANGVYLYKLSAHTQSEIGSKEYQEFLGKFIILK